MTDADDFVDVELRNLPVQLQQATTEHHDALLREFSLIKASGTPSSLPARLVTLINEIEERYRGIGDEQRALLQSAIEEGTTSLDITYHVPRSVAEPLFEAGQLLREADEFCRAGRHLVTLATPPVCVAYREWFIDEFVRQIAGEPPRPWTPPIGVLESPESWPTTLADGSARVDLRGELDLATAPALRDHLNALHLSGIRVFELDASGVTFVDSVGLSVILAVYRRCQEENGTVRILSPSSMMRRTLEVAGLADILEIVD